MTVTICYLYYDLLNLYGEKGNINALKYHLEEQGIKVNIEYLTINDKKDFNKYDVIYIGSGTTENLLLAKEDLIKYKNELKKEIKDNKIILSTGNSFELFGKYAKIDNEKYAMLNILDFNVIYNEKRIVKDIDLKSNVISNNIIGFENHRGIISSNEELFLDNGIIHNNFIGTYTLGPILIRNPEFCKYLIKKIILSKDKDFNIKEGNYLLEEKAYNENKKSVI